METKRNYWGYRINTDFIDFFMNELSVGRLRQGWGYDEGQNLRNMTVNDGASRNYPIFKRVKKGDILLVPRLPKWNCVALVEATEDFDKGYRYEIDEKKRDYGHIFPARFVKSFDRNNGLVTGAIRNSLRNPMRFWNLSYCGEDIEVLLNADEKELSDNMDYESRFDGIIESTVDKIIKDSQFSKNLIDIMTKQLQSSEWETALVHGLKKLFPNYVIEKVGGQTEAKHGTDIRVAIPGIIEGTSYLIAIQVKDHYGQESIDALAQLNKADSYWGKDEGQKLIDKILLITQSEKDANVDLESQKGDVTIMYMKDLQELLLRIAKVHIGQSVL